MLWDRCLSVCLSETLVYCGQTVRWIKMKLGKQVGLDPGHLVLDGDPPPPSPLVNGMSGELDTTTATRHNYHH